MIILYRLSLLLGIVYSLILWNIKFQEEHNENIVTKEIVFVHCKIGNTSDYISVSHKGTIQRVEVGKNFCRKTNKQNEIDLVYNSHLDRYYIQGASKSNRNIGILFLILFLLSFINTKKNNTHNENINIYSCFFI